MASDDLEIVKVDRPLGRFQTTWSGETRLALYVIRMGARNHIVTSESSNKHWLRT